MKIKNAWAFCILLSIVQSAFAQDSAIVAVDLLHKYVSNNIQEKIYVQTDRNDYGPGDTIWFKATVVNAVDHKPAMLEQIIYIDVISSGGNVVHHKAFEVTSGTAAGSLAINHTIKPGYYTLTAFTRYMQNFSKDFFFSKEIRIKAAYKNNINISRPLEIKPSQKGNSTFNKEHVFEAESPVHLYFFPEGGEAMAGFINNIAFKANDHNGRPLKIEGGITDQNNRQISTFKTGTNGMGRFSFLALSERNYMAKVNYLGKEYTFNLPEIKTNIAMIHKLREDSKRVYLSLCSHDRLIGKRFWLIGHTRGQVYFVREGDIKDREQLEIIPKEKFPSGIACITLFVDGEPMSERLLFMENNDQLNINIKTDKENYGKREKVTATIAVTDTNGMPISGEFSFLAKDAGITKDIIAERGIWEYLILSSDLHGKNEISAMLTDNQKTMESELDLIMMTNGWRRFSLKEAINNVPTDKAFEIEKGLYLKGSLSKLNDKQAKKGMDIDFFLRNENGIFIEKPLTDSSGSFKIDLPYFYGEAGVSFKTDQKKLWNQNYKTLLTTNLEQKEYDPLSQKTLSFPYQPIFKIYNTHIPEEGYSLTNNTEKKERKDNYFFDNGPGILIEEVDIISTFYNKRDSVIGMLGQADAILESSQIEDIAKERPWAFNIWSYLDGKIPGLYLYFYETIDSNLNTWEYLRPKIENRPDARLLIMVDNYLLKLAYDSEENAYYNDTGDFDLFNSMDPYDIESVSFISSPNLYLNDGGDGMFASGGSVNLDLESKMDYVTDMMDEYSSLTEEPALLYVTTKSGRGIFAKNTGTILNSFTMEGLTRYREFYSPDYQKDTTQYNAEKDIRKTLFWNPFVKTDDNGKATVSFFTNDSENNIQLVAMGVSQKGRIGESTLSIDRIQNTETVDISSSLTVNTDSIWQVIMKNGFLCGKIIDESTKSPVYNVQIFSSYPTFFHVASNSQGEFIIPGKNIDDTEELNISCPGYKDMIIKTSNLKEGSIPIFEVYRTGFISIEDSGMIETFDAEDIVKKSINKTKNLSTGKDILNGFYREDINIEGDYYGIYESAITLSQGWINGDNLSSVLNTVNFRNMEDKFGHRLFAVKPNHTDKTYPLKLDIRYSTPLFWKASGLKFYDFSLKGSIVYQGHECHVIEFDQKDDTQLALEKGKLFIDKENQLLLHVRWNFSPKGIKYLSYQQFINSMPNSIDIYHDTSYYEANYHFNGERLILLSTLAQINLVSPSHGSETFKKQLVIYQMSRDKTESGKTILYETLIEDGKTKNSEVKNVKYGISNWKDIGLIKPEDNIFRDVRFLHDVTFIKP